MSEQAQSTEPGTTGKEPVFTIEKIYVKDLSLEIPHAPRIFLENSEPQVEMRVATAAEKLEDEFYNVTVTVTVTAKLAEDKVMFLNEVAQSGIFRISNIAEDDMQILLAVAAPNILFPYAREVVSSTVSRAGFPPVMLAPINFEAIYQAQQDQAGNA